MPTIMKTSRDREVVGPWLCVDDIERASSDAGQHYFEPSTMRRGTLRGALRGTLRGLALADPGRRGGPLNARQIAGRLQLEGVPAPRGGRWWHTTVAAVIRRSSTPSNANQERDR